METRGLEYKDIAGNLPYDLKGRYVDMYGNIHICSITNFNSNKFGKGIGEIIPIYYPLNTLYKPIIHNGKEIIPIVELAKISITGLDWKLGKTIYGYSYCAVCEGWYFDFNGRFMYYSEEDNYAIPNDWRLYDFLHELKIDYRGLIDAGLAVDVNTLNKTKKTKKMELSEFLEKFLPNYKYWEKCNTPMEYHQFIVDSFPEALENFINKLCTKQREICAEHCKCCPRVDEVRKNWEGVDTLAMYEVENVDQPNIEEI